MQLLNVSSTSQFIDVQISWNVIIGTLTLLLFFLLFLQLRSKYPLFPRGVELKSLSLNIAGSSIHYDIKRNYQNLEIAHRIYVELITRKAAIPFDDEFDIIHEVYESWYALFKAIRNEIKGLSGETLYSQKDSETIVKMASDILNQGLRPHLTKYQGKYRKWYEEQIVDSKGQSPQEIQKKYREYSEMVEDIKRVNGYLIQYKEQLESFIFYSKNNH